MQKKRYVVLDALSGFAILGICLANFPEFSLWTFSDPSGWSVTDKVTRAVQTFLIDGKFYTLFSLLFGMGFSIQIANAGQKTWLFYRRMIVLFLIGLCHLLLLWSGDILMLYAAMGMILPLFKGLSTRKILSAGGIFLILPVLCEALFGTRLSDPLLAEQWMLFARPGKVACTNYLMQSVFGVLIFYGIGFGLGGKVSLLGTEVIALGVYALEMAVSALWLRYFRFGPVEWVWRMLTYGQRLPLRN